MARVASRPQIVEIESQVGLFLNGYLMIGMQVTIAASERVMQLSQHLLHRWNAESSLSEHSYDLGLPITIDTSPAVALEAENPQTTVVSIITAFGACTTMFIVLTLSRAAVRLARATRRELGTSREGAWAQDHALAYRRRF